MIQLKQIKRKYLIRLMSVLGFGGMAAFCIASCQPEKKYGPPPVRNGLEQEVQVPSVPEANDAAAADNENASAPEANAAEDKENAAAPDANVAADNGNAAVPEANDTAAADNENVTAPEANTAKPRYGKKKYGSKRPKKNRPSYPADKYGVRYTTDKDGVIL